MLFLTDIFKLKSPFPYYSYQIIKNINIESFLWKLKFKTYLSYKNPKKHIIGLHFGSCEFAQNFSGIESNQSKPMKTKQQRVPIGSH